MIRGDSIVSRIVFILSCSKKCSNAFFFCFLDDQFVYAVMDFFIPVAITVPCHIGLLLQATLAQPRIEARVREEISTVVGHGRLPTLDDRIK